MSVTFHIKGGGRLFDDKGEETGTPYVNFSNHNARRLLLQLGLPRAFDEDMYGEIRARDLKALCERYLTDPVTELEAAQPATITKTAGPTVVSCQQEASVFSHRIRRLLDLAQQAGDLGVIVYD